MSFSILVKKPHEKENLCGCVQHNLAAEMLYARLQTSSGEAHILKINLGRVTVCWNIPKIQKKSEVTGKVSVLLSSSMGIM